MPDHVTFRGAKIRYYDGRHQEGGSFIRIHITTEFTQPVLEAMGWTDPGPSGSEVNLIGEMVGTHLVLTPNEKNLRDQEISLDINEVSAFKLVTIEKNESKRRELRFVVRSPSPEAAALVDGYVRKVGDFEAALKVSYSKQETLLAKAPEANPDATTGCVSCANDIAFEDDKKKKHVNGIKCSRKVTQMTVPGAAAEPAVN